MRIPTILAISLVAVLAGSLLLVAPFSVNSIIPKQTSQPQQAEAAVLPLMVRDRFTEIQMVGDAENGSNLVVDENFVDPENHCEFCTRVEYTPGSQGAAGFSYGDAAGLDLSNAKKVRFWVMGEEGNEKIKFKLAGKSLDKVQDTLGKPSGKLAKGIFKTERFALTTEEVALEGDWKKYEVDLGGVDLKGITHPFAFELSGNGGQKQIMYLKGVIYDDEPAEDPLAATADELIEPLAAGIISNSTEGVAPATFEFEANVTGGAEPYSMIWNFDDDNEYEGQNVVHTFAESEEYDVTLVVSDAEGQNASDSVMIQLAKPEAPEIVEEEVDNSIGNTNSSAQEETNSTGIQTETNPTNNEEIIPQSLDFEADAGIDIVVQPGDTFILGGVVTGVNPGIEGLDLVWTQTFGPTVEIDDAESLNPKITIPNLEDDAEIELEFAANLGSVEDTNSVTVFVQHIDEIEGADEEPLEPVDSAITEWANECDDLADCMGDDSDDTFAAAFPEDIKNVNLFSFEEFEIENAEIEYVTAVATARAEETGYLMFIGADAQDEDDQSESLGTVPIFSDSPREYKYIWEENPVTKSQWTAESLSSFLAGYAYGAGESEIEVSEFHLIITYIIEEPTAEEENIKQVPEQRGNETVTNSTR